MINSSISMGMCAQSEDGDSELDDVAECAEEGEGGGFGDAAFRAGAACRFVAALPLR